MLGDGWRQAGSAFKPFNYVTGINDKTMTAATMLMDVTTNFGGANYIPTDADNLERGPVRVREALAVLAQHPGRQGALVSTASPHVFDKAKEFGMDFQIRTGRRRACR